LTGGGELNKRLFCNTHPTSDYSLFGVGLLWLHYSRGSIWRYEWMYNYN